MDIISHASNVTKGNGIVTYEKLNSALKYSPDMIEVDLNLTKDNKFICIHDPFLENKRISNSTFLELKKINPDVLEINEVFDIVNKRKPLLLDIKNYGINNFHLFSRIIDLVNSHKEEDYIFESFDLDLLNDLKYNTKKDIIVLANLFSKTEKVLKHSVLNKSMGVALSSEFFSKSNKYKLYKDKLKDNQKMYAWTWNAIYKENEKLFNNYLEKECDGIIADEIKILKKLKKV